MVSKNTAFCTLLLAFAFTFASARDFSAANPRDLTTTTRRPSPRPTRTKRMYKMCPPNFQRIGNECYYFSTYKANWLDAHFECKDRNSKLAEPLRLEDRRIRKYLLQYDKDNSDKWIGANYNWERQKWQWGYSGRDLSYQAFSRMSPGARSQLKYHCAVLSSDLRYRWSPRQCTNLHNFVCQHKMPFVSEKNRVKIYQKWNDTYPNQLANEIEVIVSNNQRSRNRYQSNSNSRDLNRIHPVPTTPRPRGRNSDINPNNYGDGHPADRRSRQQFHEAANLDPLPKIPKVKIPSFRDQAAANSFRVDSQQPNQAGQRVGGIVQKISYDDRGQPVLTQDFRRHRIEPPVIATLPPTTTPTTTTTRTTTTTTQRPTFAPVVEFTTLSPGALEAQRKKAARDEIRERLARMTPEEQKLFFEMRKQRKSKQNRADNNA